MLTLTTITIRLFAPTRLFPLRTYLSRPFFSAHAGYSIRSCISQGRQGVGSFVRNSYVSTLCTVVICPYLCTSNHGMRRVLYWRGLPVPGLNVLPGGAPRPRRREAARRRRRQRRQRQPRPGSLVPQHCRIYNIVFAVINLINALLMIIPQTITIHIICLQRVCTSLLTLSSFCCVC